MPAYVVTTEDLAQLKAEILDEVSSVVQKAKKDAEGSFKSEILRTNEVRKLLKVSHATLCNLRANGTLPFAKIGGSIYYDRKDVEDLIRTSRSDNANQ